MGNVIVLDTPEELNIFIDKYRITYYSIEYLSYIDSIIAYFVGSYHDISGNHDGLLQDIYNKLNEIPTVIKAINWETGGDYNRYSESRTVKELEALTVILLRMLGDTTTFTNSDVRDVYHYETSNSRMVFKID